MDHPQRVGMVSPKASNSRGTELASRWEAERVLKIALPSDYFLFPSMISWAML
jgi:hypothetical protein